MHFYKLFTAGQAYIFVDDINELEKTDSVQIRHICDGCKGAGAQGFFGLYQNGVKKVQIKAFDKNGVIMNDLSSVAVCAALGAKITNGRSANEFSDEKGGIFTYISNISDGNFLVSCDLGKCRNLLKNGITQRKTELGNRILTLTAVYTSSAYAVHFSSCAGSLNRVYLSEKASRLSLFTEKPKLVLCEEETKNTFRILPLCENGRDIAPYAGAFAAVGLAACLTEKSSFSEEISVKYEDYTVYVVCKKDLSVTVHLSAEIGFQGNIC